MTPSARPTHAAHRTATTPPAMPTTPATLAERTAARGTLAFADNARTAPLGLVVGVTAAGVLWIAHGATDASDPRYRAMVERFDDRERRAAERAADRMLRTGALAEGAERRRRAQDRAGHPMHAGPLGSAERCSAERTAIRKGRECTMDGHAGCRDLALLPIEPRPYTSVVGATAALREGRYTADSDPWALGVWIRPEDTRAARALLRRRGFKLGRTIAPRDGR